jgi:two-component system, cell cycle sensor histidine kinase and response regulator CckA
MTRGTILVVDDDAAVLLTTARMLQRAGFSTHAINTPAEALELISGEPVDVLLSDVVMPDMNGLELAAAVRERHPGIEVVLMSGFTPAALMRHKLTEDGAPAILQKPVAREELVTAVGEAVARSRPHLAEN